MKKDQFLSGAKFRHKILTTHVYQFSPGSTTEGMGYIWQINEFSNTRNCVAICDEISEGSANASFVLLGEYYSKPFKFSDFEILEK